jgi:hypothetical protein
VKTSHNISSFQSELKKDSVETASIAATKGSEPSDAGIQSRWTCRKKDSRPKKPTYLVQIKDVWDLTYQSDCSEAGGQWVLENVPRAEWPRPVKLPKGTVVRRFPDYTTIPKAMELPSWYRSPTGMSAPASPAPNGVGTTTPLDYDDDDKASVASTLRA